MQGIVSCALALGSYFLIVNFPEKAQTTKGLLNIHFLSNDEAAFVVARIEKDRHDAIPEDFHIGSYLRNALDLKVWGFASLFMLTTANVYVVSYFLPIILYDGMGFSLAASECLVTPPYVAAAIVMFAFAWAGDKYRIRSPFIIFNGCLSLVGEYYVTYRFVTTCTYTFLKVCPFSASHATTESAILVFSLPLSPVTPTSPVYLPGKRTTSAGNGSVPSALRPSWAPAALVASLAARFFVTRTNQNTIQVSLLR
jgi:hypothetical protein